MLRAASVLYSFHPQRDIPVLAQLPVFYNGPKSISVGYVLCRPQTIRPDLHPLEIEAARMLDNEYKRYGRHGSETMQSFFSKKGINLDNWSRSEEDMKRNVFKLDLYGDVHQTMCATWNPEPRTTPEDVLSFAPNDKAENAQQSLSEESRNKYATTPYVQQLLKDPPSPQRHTLRRALSDFLYLIHVRGAAVPSNLMQIASSNTTPYQWSIPYTERRQGESLRMTLERCMYTHHGDNVEYSIITNAPQGVFYRNGDPNCPVYIFILYYLEGIPNVNALGTDHAWVTRQELIEYNFFYGEQDKQPGLKQLLYDITLDGTGDVIDVKFPLSTSEENNIVQNIKM